MEYYDHYESQEMPQRGEEHGYRDYRNQYGSYRTTYREQGQGYFRQYRNYRNQYYTAGRNNYYHYNYGRDGGQGYYRGDHDLREDRDMRRDQIHVTRSQPLNNHEYYGGEKSWQQSESENESSSVDSTEYKKNGGAAKSNQKEKNRTHHASHSEEESNGSISDDMNLEKELYPISHYLESDDREEMLIQVFKVIRGTKLRAMLGSVLKDIDITELKRLCLDQLEGMSKKRIRAIFAGEEMEDSSATEDEEKDENIHNQSETTITKSTVEWKKQDNNNIKAELDVEPEDKLANPVPGIYGKVKKEEKSKKKQTTKHVLGHVSGVVQFKSSGRHSDKIRGTNVHKAMSSESSGEELDSVAASGNVERKRKQELKEKFAKTRKIGFKVRKHTKGIVKDKKDDENETGDTDDQNNKSGKTLMELLELEMRARAIKALLGNKNSDISGDDNKVDQYQGKSNESEKPKEVNEGSKEAEELYDYEEEVQKEMEEKRLQKAREHLYISEAKKREEEETVERKHAEIRKSLEEQQKMKEAKELEAKRKEEEQIERKRKAQKKKEEYEKFLQWKEERQRRKEEKKRFALKCQQEDEWYTLQVMRKKERHPMDKEKQEEDDSAKLLETTELKGSMTERVDVSDDGGEHENSEDEDLNRKFEITFSHDASMDGENLGSETEDKVPPPQSNDFKDDTESKDAELKHTSEKSKPEKRRRYRRKNSGEGQVQSGDDPENMEGSDGLPNAKSYSGSNISLNNTESSEGDDDKIDQQRIEMIRRRRAEIRQKNRRRKLAADIEEGEVDSDGEHFEPMEKSMDPKIRMILHHFPKKQRKETNSNNTFDEDVNNHQDLPAAKELYRTTHDINDVKRSEEIECQSEGRRACYDLDVNQEEKTGEKIVDKILEELIENVAVTGRLRLDAPDPRKYVQPSHSENENSDSTRKNTFDNPNLTRRTKLGHALSSMITHSTRSKNKGNIDRPNKEQVDKQQEEIEGLTWADRWYQNKNVQKVVQHSQLMSKVRSNIKIKLKDPESLHDSIAGISCNGFPSSMAVSKADEETEIIVGSMEEYAKIVGKTTEQLKQEEFDKDSEENESDEEGNGHDDLWGAIMGKK